jgi:transposase
MQHRIQNLDLLHRSSFNVRGHTAILGLTETSMPGFAWREEKSLVMPRARKYPEELLERATRLVLESGRPIAHVGRDLGVAPETLRKYVRQVEANEGRRKEVLSSQEREEIKKLRRENFELRRANEILKAASVFFAGELDPHRPK